MTRYRIYLVAFLALTTPIVQGCSISVPAAKRPVFRPVGEMPDGIAIVYIYRPDCGLLTQG